MMLYRVTQLNSFDDAHWKPGEHMIITRKYYSPTKDEAIIHFMTVRGKDPLDFMLNLHKYTLMMVENLSNRDEHYANAVVRSIEMLG